jgi:hypothetical protein
MLELDGDIVYGQWKTSILGSCSVAIMPLEFDFSRYMGFRNWRRGVRCITGCVELTSMCAISQLEGADIDGAVEGESSWRMEEEFGGHIANAD